jgi:GntR family transcriptional repressor for pyruvate dehydrogenase complex
MKLEPINRVTVVETVTERLLSLITEGHVRPGERLPSESELMEQLRVGRSSVREALHGLALVGIVEAKPRRGRIVISPTASWIERNLQQSLTAWALRDLFEVRILLESRAAERAAKMATEAEIKAIAMSAKAVERRIEKSESYFAENADFHLKIAAAAHNPVLANCLASMIGSLRDVRERMNLIQSETPRRDIDDHRRILGGTIQSLEVPKAAGASSRATRHRIERA